LTVATAESVVRRCTQCGKENRPFANFCRACAAPLPPSPSNWTGYKGDARRLGFNPARGPASWTMQKPALTLRLGDECRALLACDGHLIAVSMSGTIEVADPARARSICRFQTQGPVTAQPCISNGILYVSTRNQITSYALPPLLFDSPRVRPLWQAAIDGTPLFALTPAGNRVFATVANGEWREVHVVEANGPRATARSLLRASKMSWLAGDPATGEVVFFSEDGGRVQLHVVRDSVVTHPVPLQTLAEQPIALLGGAAFGIFGAARQLHRIAVANGAVEESLENDTQLFALTQDANGEWDRDGVRIDTDGVSFARSGIRDSFAPIERAARPSPIVLHDAAAIVGMDDGRVLVYELAHLPHHDVWRLEDGHSSTAITALASFDRFIAAGNRDGVVEVRELRQKGMAQ